MRNLMIFGLLVMMLVAAQFATGQTVDEVINKYVDTLGGKDKLNAIKSIYKEGTMEMMSNEITVRVTKEQGKLSRTEFDVGGSTGFRLVTAKEAWSYIPMRSPTPVKLSDAAAASMQTELDIAGPLVDYVAKGHKAELIGKDTLHGNECYKIKLITAAGKEILFWINTKTYLLDQSSQQNSGMGDGKTPIEVISVYKDYSPVDGIMIAHIIETTTQGGKGMNGGTTFDKIQLNIPVDAKLYKPE